MNNNGSKDEKQRQREEEVRVLESFLRLIRRQFETSESIQAMATSQIDNKEYLAERRLLMQINQLGLSQGVFAGVLTFVFLRRAPHYVANRLVTRQRQQGVAKSGYTLDRPNQKNPFQSSNAFTEDNFRAPLSFRALRFALDSMASLVVAASTSLYFTDLNTMFEKATSIPLVEGKSMVSQEFCSPMILEYKRLYQENPNTWKNTSNPSLTAIRGFVQNCQFRQAHEQQLRQEQGLSMNHADDKFPSIPSPGVNKDISVGGEPNTQDEFGNDASHFGNEQDFFGEQHQEDAAAFEKEWADSMTSSDNDKKGGSSRGF